MTRVTPKVNYPVGVRHRRVVLDEDNRLTGSSST